MNNLINLPSVYSPTIIGREDRADYMRSQAAKYKFNLYLHPVNDFYTHRDEFKVTGPFIHEDNFIPENFLSFNYCTFISYLRCLKIWYNTTEEESVIVCDDDTDFSVSDYWNFTWSNFYKMLPKKWKCVQLIRMRKNLNIDEEDDWKSKQLKEVLELSSSSDTNNKSLLQYKLINRSIITQNSGGGVFLLNREYVKLLLDHFTRGEDYHLSVIYEGDDAYPFPEVCVVSLCLPGEAFNFPMFVENIFVDTTYFNSSMQGKAWKKIHCNSRDFYHHFWKENSKNTNIFNLFNNKNINFN